MLERIQKVLATKGIASRREIEKWIKAGRITVNGKLAELGDKVEANDKIRIDNRLIKQSKRQEQKCRVLIYNKPEGEVCTRDDPEDRPTVFKNLPRLREGRWISVGRLDINTSGLLLFTTDGELAHTLMHPSSELEREYAVRVFGQLSSESIKKLKSGVKLEDGIAHFDTVQFAGGDGSNTWYHVTLKEGKNREVRRLWETQGVRVSRLIRVRFGDITLPRYLSRGKFKELEPKEISKLKTSLK